MTQAKIEVADQSEALFLLEQDHAGIANLSDARKSVIRRCVVRYNHLNIRIRLAECAANGSESQGAAIDGRDSYRDSPGNWHDGLVTNVPFRVACQRKLTAGDRERYGLSCMHARRGCQYDPETMLNEGGEMDGAAHVKIDRQRLR